MKRKRSAKQRANDKRLGRMAKARARKTTTRKRKSTRKGQVRKTARPAYTKVKKKVKRRVKKSTDPWKFR